MVLTAGRSTVLRTDFDIIRIAVTNPAVADAVVVQNREILVDGKSPGTISLIVWSSTDRKHYDLVVEPAITTLQQQLRALFPGEDITVSATDEAIILSGAVSSNSVSLRAAEIAQASSAKVKVINMLQLPSGQESQQVMLQVRFAEVNRRALTELGASFVVNRADYVGRVATQQFAAPNLDDEARQRIRLQRFPERVLLQPRTKAGRAIVKALQSKGFFQSLAEPNLIAYNGQEASFLAGGEIPVPIVQGSGANSAVTVMYKEFGIKLKFTPDDCRRRHPAESRARGEHARLRQRDHAAGIPRARAGDAEGRNERRASRRPVVRHCGPARQPDAGRLGGHSDPEQGSDPRESLQEQGRSRRADRADGAHHAAAGARARA